MCSLSFERVSWLTFVSSPRTAKITSYSARRVVISDSESDNDVAARDKHSKVSTDITNALPNKSRQVAPLEVGIEDQSQPRPTVESGDVDEVAESVDDDAGSVEDDGASLILYFAFCQFFWINSKD